MYYEVEVDLLFLENLWMNLILLMITGRLCGIQVRPKHAALAAVLGSTGACVLTVCSAQLTDAGYYLGMILLSGMMTRIGLPGKHHFAAAFAGLYLESFALGGILHFFKQMDESGGMRLLAAEGIASGLLAGLEWAVRLRRRRSEFLYEVTLHCGTGQITVQGWYDTGNGLYDPYNGKPVSVLQEAWMKQLLRQAAEEPIPRMIPYETIDGTGIMTVYILDAMEVSGSDGKVRVRFERPEVACMPETIRSCQILLHRDLLSS